MKHAVVIAGDFRTFAYARLSAASLIHGADVYMSTWSESKFMHSVSRKVFDMGRFNADDARTWFQNFTDRVNIDVEPYDAAYWRRFGYNSNYLHRMRRAIDAIKTSGIEYDSVLFMRPDLMFNEAYAQQLRERIRDVQPGQMLTFLSNLESRTLNDMLFALHGSDIDKVIPTVAAFQTHKHADWHSFLYQHVTSAGIHIKNVDDAEYFLVLRPPIESASVLEFGAARRNQDAWNDIYVLHSINVDGIKTAVRAWGKRAVIRAIENIVDGTSSP